MKKLTRTGNNLFLYICGFGFFLVSSPSAVKCYSENLVSRGSFGERNVRKHFSPGVGKVGSVTLIIVINGKFKETATEHEPEQPRTD